MKIHRILRHPLRSISVFIILVLAGLVALCALNYVRIGMADFQKSAGDVLRRSRQIRDLAASGYQAKALAGMSGNPNNGIFFRFDDLLESASVRAGGSATPGDVTAGTLLNLTFQDSGQAELKPALGRSGVRFSGGIAIVQHKRGDYLTSRLKNEIPMLELGEVAFRARADKPTRMKLAWLYDGPTVPVEMLWENQVTADLPADGAFHTYVINMKDIVRRRLRADAKVTTLLLDPSDTTDMTVEIEYIRLISTRAKYLAQRTGAEYEVAGSEMRRCLYMIPPQSLEYAVRVPENAMLQFGSAVLVDGEAVKFDVSIMEGSRTTSVYSKTLDSADAWHDAALDMSAWSGREVRVAFRASGSGGNVALWSNPILSGEPKRRFNVIVILEDALRSDHLSSNGYGLPTTPVKDKLFAESGVTFENAFSQSCKTRSSVPSLMTSLLPTVTGVWHFPERLPEEYLTLAEIMRYQGFVTASFIQNSNAGSSAGLHQGFGQLIDGETLGHSSEGILGSRLKSWLENNKRRNFFLYLHLVDPHGPYDPPPPYDMWYKSASTRGTPVKRTYLDPPTVREPTDESRRLLYDGEIRHNDALTPELLEALKSFDIYQDTLLVFISDHGEHLGEHGLWNHGEPGFVETIGVPIGLVYPARFHTGKKISEPVQLLDVMPTILELSSVDASKLLLQGDSLVDLIEGRRMSYWQNRMVVSEEPDEMAIRTKEPRLCGSLFFHDWHLISSRSLFTGSWRLPPFLRLQVFDYRRDHREDHPLVSFIPDLYVKQRFASILAELQSNNIEAWKRLTGNRRDQIRMIDPEAEKRLKALGYVK